MIGGRFVCSGSLSETVYRKLYGMRLTCAHTGRRRSSRTVIWNMWSSVTRYSHPGSRLLAEMKKTAAIPVITKPSKVRELSDDANYIFDLGARATDLYSLLYENPDARVGDTEYTTSPYAY